MKLEAKVGQKHHHLDLRPEGGKYLGRVGGRRLEAEVVERGSFSLIVRLGSRTFDVTYSANGCRFDLDFGGREIAVEILDPRRPRNNATASAREQGRHEIRAAMPGKIVAVKAKVGEKIESGQGLVVMEAMKMENEVPAPRAGKVVSIDVEIGQTVETGALLAAVE